jgi:hypothetical protein
MIVSIHIPKTAGTTFLGLLKNEYGDKLVKYYKQKPLKYRYDKKDPKKIFIECISSSEPQIIHGHFVADRVINVKNPSYITWLRNPVERVISHYFHWTRNPDLSQPLCKKMIETNMTLLEFAREDSMQNIQSYFLGDVDIEKFDFIGITEKFNKSIELFNSLYNVDLKNILKVNNNPNKQNKTYENEIDNDIYDNIRQLNLKDMNLYRKACKRMEIL